MSIEQLNQLLCIQRNTPDYIVNVHRQHTEGHAVVGITVDMIDRKTQICTSTRHWVWKGYPVCNWQTVD